MPELEFNNAQIDFVQQQIQKYAHSSSAFSAVVNALKVNNVWSDEIVPFIVNTASTYELHESIIDEIPEQATIEIATNDWNIFYQRLLPFVEQSWQAVKKADEFQRFLDFIAGKAECNVFNIKELIDRKYGEEGERIKIKRIHIMCKRSALPLLLCDMPEDALEVNLIATQVGGRIFLGKNGIAFVRNRLKQAILQLSWDEFCAQASSQMSYSVLFGIRWGKVTIGRGKRCYEFLRQLSNMEA